MRSSIHARVPLKTSPPLRILIDESDVDPVLLSATDIRLFKDRWIACPRLDECRVAVVAPATLMYGLNRMFQLLLASDEIEIFRKRDDAMRWLGR